MSNTFIQEAFKQFYLTEDAEEFSLNVSGPDDVESFLDVVAPEEDEEVISDVYDLEAEAKEDLKQSYIGKVILDCNVCHSNVFFNKDEITENEDGLCCVEIECPYCMSNEGYTIIGEVKPYQEEEEVDIEDIETEEVPEEEVEKPEVDVEVDVEETEEEPEVEEDELEESLNEDVYDGKGPIVYVNNNKIIKIDKEEAWDDYEEYPDADKYFESVDMYGPWVPKKEFVTRIIGEDKSPMSYEDLLTYLEDEDNTFIVRKDRAKKEGLKADEVKELRGDEEINGADGTIAAVDELEGNDEIRGPKYTELNEEVEEETEEELKELEECGDPEKLDECGGGDAELVEDIEDVSINTEDENITMTTKEDGGVVVETSPKEEAVVEDEVLDDTEMIAPLEPETEADIEDAVEMNDEEEAPMDDFDLEDVDLEGGEEELGDDFEEFDEESFDNLGESYLKRCYENVTSFKTSNITLNENKEFIIEGKIGFDSGNEKDTQFIFAKKSSEDGKLKLEGYNKQISNGKKTFKLNCSINDKALICESLNYNYKGKNELNESVRVYGTVKRK